ncbi:L,D-transpeptidase family protein [Capnocytophaga canis]|uniref:L,D-transpeptidase family protein n=1 Tax=Capnocytophaga canis TaxID=1848903 RepID=UPI001561E3C2|nr:L,D-transpeptidase family protein [Capnocytophaga canis]
MNKCLLVLLAGFLLFQSCKNNPNPKELIDEIKSREVFENNETISFSDTTQLSFERIAIKDKEVLAELKSFYSQNGYNTRWLYEKKPTPLFYGYMKVLEKSENYGLNPETYRHKALKYLVDSLYSKTIDFTELEQADREITASFLLLTKHLGSGRVSKLSHGQHIWKPTKRNRNDVEILLKLEDTDDLVTVVDALHPSHLLYKRMSEKYAELIADTQQDSMGKIVFENPKLFVNGYKHSVVEAIRHNLQQQGYEAVPLVSANVVDTVLLNTLKKFQEVKGITPDGVPGKTTLYHLNMTKTQKVELLKLNMERMRWLNNDLGDDYIIVNIPDFKLFVYHKDSMIHQMNVVVGREYTATPVFVDSIRHVEFRPTWTVPQSIIHNEMIPQMVSENDAEKYQKRGYTIYENGEKIDPNSVDWTNPEIRKRKFRFVEAPSARNSLGLVKFILTNDMSIYLHDTPSTRLFSREERAFSHGCVRVEQPAELAYLLLKNQDEWTREKVDQAMQSGPNQNRITLKNRYLISLLYITAWVDENNQLIIKNDIYGFDQQQLKELKVYE